MTAATPLDYAGRCVRYLAQRGILYDRRRMSVGHLTPRQRRRAIKKERSAWPPYSRRSIDMPWDERYGAYNDGHDGAFYDDDYAQDPHDFGYCVVPGCNCCGDD